MNKKEKKAKLLSNIPDAYKRISDAVHHEGKRVLKLMNKFSSDNESKFIKLLDENNIKYTFHKIFYKTMQNNSALNEKYYIAQFWLYKKRLIVEVEANRKLPSVSMEYRTYDALEVFPKAQCIKISEESLNDHEFMTTLIAIIK